MLGLKQPAGLLLAALSFATASAAVSAVTRTGRYLYNADGSRFYIKGIAYQEQGDAVADPSNPFLEPSTYTDPLADGASCSRDIPYLQQLGVNTIRVYSVDNTQNHDACMSALSSAGIYTMIDLSLPVNGSIDRDSPAWTTNLLDLYLGTINVFSKYDNVLGYNVGNEVVTAVNATSATAFVKAAARDVKAYLKSKSSTALVGYAAIDADASWLDPLASYLSCDPSGNNSGDTAIDIFGLNDYEWCGNAASTTYDAINSQFENYNVAAYFSEFGCVTGTTPRVWTEVGTIFASPMSNIWSGGIAFAYFPSTSAAGQFGMVTVDGNTVTTSTDFANLKTQYGQVSPPNSPSASGSASYSTCPAQSDTWLASTTLPPTPNAAACQCLDSDLSCSFTPPTNDNTTVINVITGTLLDETCSLLGSSGANCLDIAGNGTSGTYGRVSFCQPREKLSYIMSQYYELQNHVATACDFAGNATINSKAPSSSGAAAAAASSCVSNPSATFVPSSVSGGPSSTGSGSSGGGSGSGSSGAISLMSSLESLLVVLAISSVGAAWTLMA